MRRADSSEGGRQAIDTSIPTSPPREQCTPPPGSSERRFGRCVRNAPQDGCAERLEALGLRVGKVIEKVSGMPFHGPVTLLLDGRQIAIGWKISSSILVSPLKGRFSAHDRAGT